MRKFVIAAICELSLSLSVTTGRKCIKEARTQTAKKCCEQQLRRVDKALSRAGDIPEGSWICLSHRNLILEFCRTSQNLNCMVSFRISHVRYINILTWLRGFLVKLLYLVLFSLYLSLFWELRNKKKLKNLQF